MEVRVVPAIDTLPLRQRVLRPHQTIDELARERDVDDDAVYFAAIDDGAVIGTASVHRKVPPWASTQVRAWRLRDMATDEARRRRRVGTALLDAVVEYVTAQGGDLLWCKARVPAVAFYERAGFTTRGESWDEPTIGPHITMQRPIVAKG